MSHGDSEWYGEPHTLIVHEVNLSDPLLDAENLGDYDLEHPPSCTKKMLAPVASAT